MRIGEPSWWYREQGSIWARVLAPAASIYGLLAARRIAAVPRHKSRLPVVCVGNFTAGGAGKTPTVAAIVNLLAAQGHVPVVLSRGYGGHVREPTWVRAAAAARIVGDEPCVLAKRCAVVVAPDRVAGARMIETQPIGSTIGAGLCATVIVMDDGMQNPSLAKDVVISVVDAGRGVGNGLCIPAGPLRAPLETQLPMVDAIVLNTGSAGSSAGAGDGRRAFARFGGPVVRARLEPAGNVSWLRNRPVVGFAGIGVPDRFHRTLLALGADVRDMVPFPDHHAFTAADAMQLLKSAEKHGALLVTTEKDGVRLEGAPAGPLSDLGARLRTIAVSLAFEQSGEALLSDLLARRAPLRH